MDVPDPSAQVILSHGPPSIGQFVRDESFTTIMAEETPKDKETKVATRRISHMSIEAPLSPLSVSSDDSDHEDDERSVRESIREVRPSLQLSRTSSTNAVGGVVPTLDLERTWTAKSTATVTDPAFEVDFEDGDPGNPQNWSLAYRCVIVAVMSCECSGAQE